MLDTTNPLTRELLSFLRFGLSGFPAFVLALVANFFFVSQLHWPKPAAYALVVWLQMTSGFLMCRYVVFADGRNVPLARAYLRYLASMSTIRAADWCFYTAAVEFFKMPYIAAQITTMGLFIAIKFVLAKAIFDRK